MSKKNKKHFQNSSFFHVAQDYAGEYRIIKHDLLKVVLLNLLYLAGVSALYFTNLRTHYLARWFEKVLHF